MRILTLILVLFFLTSCEKLGLTTKPLSVNNIEIDKKLGDCNSKEGRCLNLKLKYPEIEDGNEVLRNAVNGTIKEFLISSMIMGEGSNDGNVITIDTAIMELEEEFRDFIDDLDFPTPDWSIESSADITFSDSLFFGVSMYNYSYTGGAHPNYVISKKIFDKETGMLVKLTDIVKDTSAIKLLVEKNFRKEVEVDPTESLEAAGFWFKNDQFKFPINIGMSSDGLEFVYNTYEVAPHAQGSIEIILPYEKIKKLMK